MRKSRLIKDTTRAEREQIVAEALGFGDDCDGVSGVSAGVEEMYKPYIEGKMELAECNMAAHTGHYVLSDQQRMSTGGSCMMGY